MFVSVVTPTFRARVERFDPPPREDGYQPDPRILLMVGDAAIHLLDVDAARQLASSLKDVANNIEAVAPAPNVILTATRIATFAGHDVAPDAVPEWTGTLEDFRAENADAFTQAEFGRLIADLAAGREHRIGGGAEAPVTIRLADTPSTESHHA
jgi:hypothetical protein